MTIQISSNGFTKITEKAQELLDISCQAIFNRQDELKALQEIRKELVKLNQIIRDESVMIKDAQDSGGPDAA